MGKISHLKNLISLSDFRVRPGAKGRHQSNHSALSHVALLDSTNLLLDRKPIFPCSTLKVASLFKTENYTQSFWVI